MPFSTQDELNWSDSTWNKTKFKDGLGEYSPDEIRGHFPYFPLGSPGFVERLEVKLGRILHPLRPGRKKKS